MRQIVLLAHISLDGFVAGPDGELDGFDAGEENLSFVCRLTETADTALLGRISYQLLDGYWPKARDLPGASGSTIAYSNWYNLAHKIVISSTMAAAHLPNTSIISGDIPGKIENLKKQPGRDILIFGSPSVSRILMQAGLIDSYWIFINPVIFGKGIRLFRSPMPGAKFTLAGTRRFANGELALNYRPPG